jgi:hypothetical protein
VIPKIRDLIIRACPDWSTADEIKKRLSLRLKKIFANRHVCNNPDCKRKFDNATYVSIARRNGTVENAVA